MGSLPLGSTLLNKYRIDRFIGESNGANMYEGTDIVHARTVQLALCAPAGAPDALMNGATVVDIGALDGATVIVTSDEAVAFPPPRQALRRDVSRDEGTPDLDTSVEEAFFAETPLFELEEPSVPPQKRRWPWFAVPIVGALAAMGGWYVGQDQGPEVGAVTVTAATVLSAPTTLAEPPPAPSPRAWADPAPAAAPVTRPEPAAKPTRTPHVRAPKPKPVQPVEDPLTL